MKTSDKWQAVEEKLEELRRLVEEAWEKGEWEQAIRGEHTIRIVEQSKAAVEELRRQLG